MHADADERYRTTTPADPVKAYQFVPFRMAVAATIRMKDDPTYYTIDTTPAKVAFVEQLVSTASFNPLPLLAQPP